MAGINLKVQIEINGQFVQAGHITGGSFSDEVFSYEVDAPPKIDGSYS